MTRHPYGCVEREYTWEGKMNTFSFYFRKSEENNNIQNIRYLRNGKSEQQSERILWSSVHEVPMYVDFLDQFDNRDLNSIRETFTITGLSLPVFPKMPDGSKEAPTLMPVGLWGLQYA